MASQEARLANALLLQNQENRLLAKLAAETLALLKPALKEVSAPQGTVFLEPGEPIEQVYFPMTGMISLLVLTKDGDMVETSTVGCEGAVGLHRGWGERQSFTRATVQVAGRFSVIAGKPFEEISVVSPGIREMIALYTEVLWAETQQLAACNAVHDASARLCRWLLQTADRIKSDQLPLTQEFLSQMLGVRRKTLEAGACECYHVIQQDKLPPRLGVGL